MSATLKNFLMISLKQALNAVLTNTALMAAWHSQFNFTRVGLLHMLLVTGTIVGAREVMVWGPIVLKWTTTNADPNQLP